MSNTDQERMDLTAKEEPEIASVTRSGLTLRMFLLSFVFGTVFSVASVYTLVVLSFSMGVVGTTSIVLASSASIYAVNSTAKKRANTLNTQEVVGMNWLSGAFMQSLGTNIVISGILIMRYILPSTSLAGWQRWWFAPPQGELGNLLSWLPVILFWTMMVLVGRIAMIGIALRLKRRYIDTDDLPYPAAEARADVARELTTSVDSLTHSLRLFLSGVIIAIIFSLVFERTWEYPLVLPLLSSVVGIVLVAGGRSNAFPWKLGRKAGGGLSRAAYLFSFVFFFIGILGLISCIYAPAGSLFYHLRYGFDSVPLSRFIDLSFLVPQLNGLGFGVAVSILLFSIGYLIPFDSSSGILIGSLVAFVMIPLGFVGLTGTLNRTLILNIDLSLTLAALFCATIVGAVVSIARTFSPNRRAAATAVFGGVKEIFTPNRVRKSRAKRTGFERLEDSRWAPFLLTWIPLTLLALITIFVVATEPGMPAFLPIIIILFVFVATPVVAMVRSWILSRTTRASSQAPFPFLYEAVLYGSGVRQFSPYAFGPSVPGGTEDIMSQLRVGRLTQTQSRVIYWADLIGFPIFGVFVSSLICLWIFGAVGSPSPMITPPGSGTPTLLEQWNFAPIWNALYTFILLLAQGGGAFPYQCDPIIFFLLPLIILSLWTILLGFKRIPIASIAGIIVGFAILPYFAITISIGALTAAIVRRIKGVEWFGKYGTILGAGIYAGASISLLLTVMVAPLIV
jgi:hypothetical protein